MNFIEKRMELDSVKNGKLSVLCPYLLGSFTFWGMKTNAPCAFTGNSQHTHHLVWGLSLGCWNLLDLYSLKEVPGDSGPPGGSHWPVIDRCWHINTPTSLALVRKTLRCGLSYAHCSLEELTPNYIPPDLGCYHTLVVCLSFSPYFPTVIIVFLKILPIKSLLQESWSQGLPLKEAKKFIRVIMSVLFWC